MELCVYCGKQIPNAKLNAHLALNHEAYRAGDIKEETIKSLNKIKDQVKLILIRTPAARSDDKVLYQCLLRYFYPSFMVYDPNDKMLKPANGRGWTWEQWRAFPSYETCRRSRQHIQEKAKKNIAAQLGTEEDAAVLPSEKVTVQRGLRESALRYYFGREKDGNQR